MDYVDYFDSESGEQKRRQCTDDEQAEIDNRRAIGIPVDEFNKPILAELEILDKKSIRALREGDSMRIQTIESEAMALRLQLRK